MPRLLAQGEKKLLKGMGPTWILCWPRLIRCLRLTTCNRSIHAICSETQKDYNLPALTI